MAESELMEAADYAAGWMPRCILLTPSLSHDQWVDAIRAACDAAGYDFIFVQDRSQRPIEGEDKRVILACDPRFLAPAPQADITVIVSEVETALEQTEVLTGAGAYDGVVDASDLLLRAAAYPCSRRAVVSRANRGPVEVLSGVFVAPPSAQGCRSADPIAVAATTAFQLYAAGTIEQGASARLAPALFEYDERQNVDVDSPRLQTMGGPRWLVRGPGLALPTGKWEVTANFSVDDDAARHRYAFDYGDREELTRLDIAPGRAGKYRLVATVQLENSVRFDLRFIICEGSMEGRFEFFGAELKLLSSNES